MDSHQVFHVALLIGYFLPTAIAAMRGHRQTLAIAARNLLLGWTVLGWIAAFIWSLTSSRREVVYIRNEREEI